MEWLKWTYSSMADLQRYGELSKQRLDRAILTFFQHLRKSYVGDQAMHSSKVIFFFSLKRDRFVMQTLNLSLWLQQLYSRLSELLGLHDHLLLLDFIVRKIATNLKCYTMVMILLLHRFFDIVWGIFIISICFYMQSEEVIDHTLSLFLELASGFVTFHSLLKNLIRLMFLVNLRN